MRARGMLRRQGGALMIEVLVTIVILAIGLLGLMQMQGRLQKSEMESYQRTQALMLANDMANRIAANRAYADDYVTTSPLGTGVTDCGNLANTSLTMQEVDSAEWCLALQGAAERQGSDSLGAMIGGRGCVDSVAAGSDYMVTVVWQGLTPISAPPVLVGCGADLYDEPAGSDCADGDNADMCRRYVTTRVRIGDLNL